MAEHNAAQFSRMPSDLEISGRAMSVASARSVASFNSEEGFGSPSTRRRKKTHAVPKIQEQFPVSCQAGSCAHAVTGMARWLQALQARFGEQAGSLQGGHAMLTCGCLRAPGKLSSLHVHREAAGAQHHQIM